MVGIDAPVVVRNPTGARDCERLFGLSSVLRYKHKAGRDIALLGSETAMLLDLVGGLVDVDPPLPVTDRPGWTAVRAAVGSASRKADLRRVEDRIEDPRRIAASIRAHTVYASAPATRTMIAPKPRLVRSRLLHHREVPGTAVLRLRGDLSRFVPARRRGPEIHLSLDGTSTLGHLVESTGVPLPEVGTLRVDGTRVRPSHRPADGSTVDVDPVRRPQPLPTTPPRFLLDVHLGRLARRMRVLGLDAEYDTAAHDADLAERAATDTRILLTQDLGLLRRRRVPHAAYVRGPRTAEQLADVLDRFAPPLDPYTRCTTCNGELRRVRKDDVADRLRPGTRRTYEEFSRCDRCGQVYWRGAHARALDAVVRAARETGNRVRPDRAQASLQSSSNPA